MRTVTFQDNSVHLIDQTALPGELRTVVCQNASDVASAIRQMTVRGAPAIGVAAACGMALDAASFGGDHPGSMLGHLRETAARLKEARPTAVNLAWAVDRMLGVAERELAGQVDSGSDAVDLAKSALRAEADIIADEDVATNRQMGAHGAELVQDGANVLTHCNTGSLATIEYGTALGVVRAAHEAGKRLHVFVDETRPFLQGARLTAWELQQEGIPHTLISDNMAGHFMMRGAVDLVGLRAGDESGAGDCAAHRRTAGMDAACLGVGWRRVRQPFHGLVSATAAIPGLPSIAKWKCAAPCFRMPRRTLMRPPGPVPFQNAIADLYVFVQNGGTLSA